MLEEKILQLAQTQNQDLLSFYKELMRTLPEYGKVGSVLYTQEFIELNYYFRLADYYFLLAEPTSQRLYPNLKLKYQESVQACQQDTTVMSKINNELDTIREGCYQLIREGLLKNTSNVPGSEVLLTALPEGAELQQLQMQALQLLGLIQNTFFSLSAFAYYFSYQHLASDFNLHVVRLYRHLEDQEALKFLIQYFVVLEAQLDVKYLALMDVDILIAGGNPQHLDVNSCRTYAAQLRQAILEGQPRAQEALLTFDVQVRQALGLPGSLPQAASPVSEASAAASESPELREVQEAPAEERLAEAEQEALRKAEHDSLLESLMQAVEEGEARMQQAQQDLAQATSQVAGELLKIGSLNQEITEILRELIENNTYLLRCVSFSNFQGNAEGLERIQKEEEDRKQRYDQLETAATGALALACQYTSQDGARAQLLQELNAQGADLCLKLSEVVSFLPLEEEAAKGLSTQAVQFGEQNQFQAHFSTLHALVQRVPENLRQLLLYPMSVTQALLVRCLDPMLPNDIACAQKYQGELRQYVYALQINITAEITDSRKEHRSACLTSDKLCTIVRRKKEEISGKVIEVRENLTLADPYTLGISNFSVEAAPPTMRAIAAGPSGVSGAFYGPQAPGAAPDLASEQQGPH